MKNLFTLTVSTLALTCACGGCTDNQKEAEREQLRQYMTQQLEAVTRLANEFDFDAAYSLLVDLRDELDNSPAADVATYGEFKSKLDTATLLIREQRSSYRVKVREGWAVIGGKLVSPADQARAIEEQRRREQAERARLVAEERRRQEAEARQQAAEARQRERERAVARRQKEQARLERDRREAKLRLADALENLPALHVGLDDDHYRYARAQWIISFLRTSIRDIGSSDSGDPNEGLISRDELARRLHVSDKRQSPILLSYLDEVMDIVANMGWTMYVVSPDALSAGDLPIRFAEYQDKPALLLGPIFSATMYNHVNQAMNTAKKRAAAFVQQEVLPVLLRTQLTDKLKAARLGAVGVVFVYGHSNFVRDHSDVGAELLCIVMSTTDLIQFVHREITQEALLRNSAVFIASEGPQFVRVELRLE